MVKYIYYDRRIVNATQVQFFHESRAKATNKEFDTNMPKDLQFDVDTVIHKIFIVPEDFVIASTTPADSGLLDELETFLKTAIIEIQVGNGPVLYLPAAAALSGIKSAGGVHYTQATAANATLAIASISGPLDTAGLELGLTVPANTDFKFFIKQATAVNIGLVQVYLLAERPG